jgi:hypothetical protein
MVRLEKKSIFGPHQQINLFLKIKVKNAFIKDAIKGKR